MILPQLLILTFYTPITGAKKEAALLEQPLFYEMNLWIKKFQQCSQLYTQLVKK
jgi:hypothetical protein